MDGDKDRGGRGARPERGDKDKGGRRGFFRRKRVCKF
jgi:hypothetical protein